MIESLARVLARVSELAPPSAAGTGFASDLTAALASTGAAPMPGAQTAASSEPTHSPLPVAAHRWLPAIEQAARRAGVDPKLLTALVWTESSFDPTAVSSAGAVGLAQLMPPTADALGVDPFDPQSNLDGGARYLKEMIDRFGTVDQALAAYNAGPTRVAAATGSGVPVSGEYVARVLSRYRSLGGTA